MTRWEWDIWPAGRWSWWVFITRGGRAVDVFTVYGKRQRATRRASEVVDALNERGRVFKR